MPYSLPPVSRRRFLFGTVAAAAALAVPSILRAAAAEVASLDAARPAPDADRFALLSDIHIAAKRNATSRGVNMFDNLWRAGEEIASSGLNPAAALFTGDMSVSSGKAGDYEQFARGVTPLRNAGLPMYLALGNHDHFGRFHDAFPQTPGVVAPAAAKQVTVVEAARANLFLLDSLGRTKATAGNLGGEQLQVLARELDARRDKPAILFVHHHPCEALWNTGLTDTAALYGAIVPRRQVKAVVFGHTHTWRLTQHDGIHLVNLPPTAYVFSGRDPNGWTDVLLGDGGAAFTLHALDKGTHRNGERFVLAWRTEA